MKYTLSAGYKLPVPGVNFSSYNFEITVEGEDYEELKEDLMNKLEDLNEEILSRLEESQIGQVIQGMVYAICLEELV